ncbi:glycosyl hydrolase family 28-related protein [Neobacillus sp. OS1-2]|uniref:glycosyl hydrolase family 28-related protein n=1 Tax=Neobacillus sp. OS1-2 TaxID=3070680 RepID=UPI0027DF4277|nr:glycosyl hydrolase family 28-related protein [Neobacillus sp. OS1-2]WML38321.1 glycosyl hydrolase family 28-related protein [Neobacillus sp. OS1-2]
MPRYDKTHDPLKNSELLERISGKRLDMVRVIKETEEYFEHYRLEPCLRISKKKHALTFSEKMKERLFRLTAKPSHLLAPSRMKVDSQGNVVPDWKGKLDHEFTRLAENIATEVNVVDFGAVGDGKTDCTEAFKKALATGRVKIVIPPGVFITKEIRLPSWTWLVGSGKGLTTIKLHNQAPKGKRLLTNANHWRGNHHIFVERMSLDWNVERLGEVTKTSTWGNHSSCLTFANVTYGWIKDVEGINPGLHCFDISSTQYNYAGDGYRARGGSKYVWIDQVTGYGFGDDGITTHHSDYIFISNSHMCDPSGRAHQKGFSNSNGIEVDDGSRNVLLVNNSSARCFGGVEIKAHQNSSAASNVQIVGHLSVNDNRAFNFRHIGHHKITDAASQSAFNIIAVNLAAIAPIFTDLYMNSTPRGMVISAYRNVVVNHFTLIGDPDYDYKGNPLIALQYRARNVCLNNLSASNFTNAGAMIKVYGGENRADSIQINHVLSKDLSSKEIEVGVGVQHIKMQQIT